MKERAETRRNIEKGIETRRRESEDRAKHMGLIVGDKKTVAKTSRKLFLSSTVEGVDKVKKALERAAKTVHDEFKKQNRDLQKKIDKCRKAEENLDERAKDARKDAVKVNKAAGHIKETKKAQHLAIQAEHAAVNDAGYIEKKKALQKKERESSERRRKKQKRQLKNAKLKW